ncbi:unnamed protein product, partial [Prorocentrum cordatum]
MAQCEKAMRDNHGTAAPAGVVTLQECPAGACAAGAAACPREGAQHAAAAREARHELRRDVFAANPQLAGQTHTRPLALDSAASQPLPVEPSLATHGRLPYHL